MSGILFGFITWLVKVSISLLDNATKLGVIRRALTRGGFVGGAEWGSIIAHALSLARRMTPPEEAFLIPAAMRPGVGRAVDNGVYQNEVMRWDIKPGELAIDIGSGANPFHLATHLGERHLGETVHRQSTRLVMDHRPMICFDVLNAPFRDKAWDFVFCSHMIEHVEKPGAALREISRIGKRGYIEAPSKTSDVLMNFTKIEGLHKWHSLVAGDTLALIEWSPSESRDMGTDYFFKSLHSAHENEFQNFFIRNRDMFFCGLRWEGEINFIVIGADGKVMDQNLPKHGAPLVSGE